MIDVHCHLNFHAFEKDFKEVAKKAFDSGVSRIINTGTSIVSSKKAVDLAQETKDFYAIIGIHPHHADKTDKEFEGILQTNWIEKLEKMAKNPKVIGIGEIGLDYFSYKSNGVVEKKLQKEVFEAQIELSHKLNLPLQIHGRLAGKDILEILNHHKNILKTDFPGMFHCFAGDLKILKGALNLGFFIGFDGNLTYPGLAPKETIKLSEIALKTPLEKIVTETDSPFLTPIPLRGSRNEPKNVIIVGEFLAKIKNISFEKLDKITTENAIKLFNL